MIRDSDKIVACPACQKPAKYISLVSGNDLGATYWSDGLRVLPMMVLPPKVVECEGCGHVYWLKDAQVLGKMSKEDTAVPPEWRECTFVREPDEAGYYLAISRGLARTQEEERHVRAAALHKSNEPFRKNQNMKPAWPDIRSRAANMESLMLFLDENTENDCLLKADILRELGRFEEALATLCRINQDTRYGDAKKKIEKWCRDRDTLVKPFNADRDTKTPRSAESKPWWKFW